MYWSKDVHLLCKRYRSFLKTISIILYCNQDEIKKRACLLKTSSLLFIKSGFTKLFRGASTGFC